jgi:hypothetical protein
LEGAVWQGSPNGYRQDACVEFGYGNVDWVGVFCCINQDWGSHRDLQCPCADDSCFLEASNFWWSYIDFFLLHFYIIPPGIPPIPPMPIPPISPPGMPPPGGIGGAFIFATEMTSSILSIIEAASLADLMICFLTASGS